MLSIPFAQCAAAQETEQDMSARIEQLEKQLKDQDQQIESLSREMGELRNEAGEQARVPPGILNQATVTLDAVGAVQASSGANQTAGGDRTDANLYLRLGIGLAIDDANRASIALEDWEGAGLDDNVATFTGINETAKPYAGPQLRELWYEHAFGERSILKIGKVDLTVPCGPKELAFDANAVANDQCRQFFSSAFVNNPAIEFPDNSFGTAFWHSPAEWLGIGLGYQEGGEDFNDVFRDPFLIMEVDLMPNLRDHPGNYRFYVWRNATDHVQFANPENEDEPGTGFGLSADHGLMRETTVFVRAGLQDERVYEVKAFAAAGLELRGRLWGRKDDALGLAAGKSFISTDFARTADFKTDDETHLELYYRYQVDKHLSISPDFQMVNNPGGDDAAGPVFIGGLRAELGF